MPVGMFSKLFSATKSAAKVTAKSFKAGNKAAGMFARTISPIRDQTKKVLSYRALGRSIRGSARFGAKTWRSMPTPAKVGVRYAGKVVGMHALGAGVAVAGTVGLVNGWREGFINAEAMYNQAHGYGAFGNESNFRNNGRMPSNHLGHAGVGLSMSRLRHG